MKGLTETARFINMLYAGIGTGYAEIRMFDSAGHVKRFYRPLSDGPAQSERLAALQTYNDAGYNIFLRIGISETERSRKEDIACLPALWVDVDDPGESAYEHLVDSAPTPNLVIATGGGWHAYWLLREPIIVTAQNRPQIEQVLKGLAVFYDGDVKVAECARIMRLPGFANNKYAHKPVAYNADGVWDGKAYAYADIARLFLPLGDTVALAPKRQYDAPKDYEHPFVRRYLDSSIGRGERNKNLYVAACFLRDGGKSQAQAMALLAGKAERDGLKRFEIERTISSAYSGQGYKLMSSTEHLRMAIADRMS